MGRPRDPQRRSLWPDAFLLALTVIGLLMAGWQWLTHFASHQP